MVWCPTRAFVVVCSLCAGCGDDRSTPRGDAAVRDGGAGFDAGELGMEGEPCSLDRDCESPLRCDIGRCSALGSDGDRCTDFLDCETGLDCVDLTCRPVGGAGQACRPGSLCDAGLVCAEELCRTTIQARFCHCITNTFGDIYEKEMSIADTVVGTAATGGCSPCATIPTGDLGYSITTLGTDRVDTGRLTFDPTWGNVSIFARASGGIEVYNVPCGDPFPGCP